jgi:16S rRNA (adenine1518-N6/adenine1519-N6)-dimethyltransferase
VLFGIARAGFAERRKQLHNALARNMSVPRATLEHWLAEAGVEPSRRAETLSVSEWIHLAQVAQRVHGTPSTHVGPTYPAPPA